MLEGIGITALGVFLGYMAWYFATRVTESWMDSFAAVAGVLFGGVVLAFIGGTSADSRWWYPIGLVIGCIVYVAFKYFGGGGLPTITTGRGIRSLADESQMVANRRPRGTSIRLTPAPRPASVLDIGPSVAPDLSDSEPGDGCDPAAWFVDASQNVLAVVQPKG